MDAAAADRDLAKSGIRVFGGFGGVEPARVTNLGQVSELPKYLAAFLGVLALATLGHALAVSSRRRVREQAMLRVLGLTSRAGAAVVAVQAGVGRGGRGGTRHPARAARGATGSGRTSPRTRTWSSARCCPARWLAVVVGVVVLGTAVMAVLPVLRTRRIRPAQALRAGVARTTGSWRVRCPCWARRDHAKTAPIRARVSRPRGVRRVARRDQRDRIARVPERTSTYAASSAPLGRSARHSTRVRALTRRATNLGVGRTHRSDCDDRPVQRGGGGPAVAAGAARGPAAAPHARRGRRARSTCSGRGRPLRALIEADRLSSVILWGPPGTGKTTHRPARRRRHREGVRAAVGGDRRREGRARGRRAGPGPPRRARPGHDPVPRRGPPLQPDPAGRAAARTSRRACSS